MKIFRILSPGKPKQLALPGSSKEFYKGLKMSFSKFQKYCILPFLIYIKSNTKLVCLHILLHQNFPHHFPCHCVCVCVCVCVLFSHVWLFATPWTVACQAPLSMEFSKQEYWSGLLFLSLGNLLPPGVEPRSPALQTDSWPSEPPRSPSIFTTIAPNNAFFLRTLKVIHCIVLQCELFFHVNAFYTLFDISIPNSDHSLLSLKSMTVHTAN